MNMMENGVVTLLFSMMKGNRRQSSWLLVLVLAGMCLLVGCSDQSHENEKNSVPTKYTQEVSTQTHGDIMGEGSSVARSTTTTNMQGIEREDEETGARTTTRTSTKTSTRTTVASQTSRNSNTQEYAAGTGDTTNTTGRSTTTSGTSSQTRTTSSRSIGTTSTTRDWSGGIELPDLEL